MVRNTRSSEEVKRQTRREKIEVTAEETKNRPQSSKQAGEGREEVGVRKHSRALR